VREILLPAGQRRGERPLSRGNKPAIGTGGEMLFHFGPVLFRQRSGREETNLPAAAAAWIPEPFHVCSSPFISGRFIFILRIFSKA
jgi:hypothetical protein